MADVLEGLAPKHYHGQNQVWYENGKQYIAVNVGEDDDPVYQYREVLYRWIGNNNRWYLAYSNNPDSVGTVSLDNARYFTGAPYRGDVALFGDGLKELPDPLPFFTGSQYKLYSNGADTLENYVNFGYQGTKNPYGIDNIYRMCKLRQADAQYLYTVTRPGQQGYNWGVGAFVGTIPTAIYPNIWSLQFRLGDFIDGQDRMWLLYGGSNVTWTEQGTGQQKSAQISFGAHVSRSGELMYYRRFNSTYVYARVQLASLSGWHQVQLTQDANHNCTITVDKGTPNEQSASCSLKLWGKQFDSVLFNCGPACVGTTGVPITDVYDKSWIGNIDIRRFYIDTHGTFNENVIPRYYEQPYLNLEIQAEGSNTWQDISSSLVNWPHEQDNRRCIYTLPDVPDGQYFIRYKTNYGVSNTLPVRIKGDISRKTELYSDFSDLIEMRENWLVAHKQWGGTGVVGNQTALLNGGVVRENVEVYPDYSDVANAVKGVLRLRGHGTYYDGDVIGVDRIGHPAPDGRKTEVGSALVTREYLGPGSFRCKLRSPYRKGAATALWTFHYEEIYENDPRWQSFLDEGLHAQGNEDDGYYIVRNHEIDIEYPTALKDAVDMEDVSADKARLNTWEGELRTWDLPESDPNYFSEYTDFFEKWVDEALSDGKWHEIRFDWHTGEQNPPAGKPAKRVDFYVDGVLKWTNTTHIPDIPGRLWIALWYPRAPGNRWAGHSADYIYDSIDVDYFHYIPFPDEPVRQLGETYPADVWRDWKWENFFSGFYNELPPPYELPKPYDDDMPKDADGTWLPTSYLAAGKNPPQYITPYRLEWRNDRKLQGSGNGEFQFLNLVQGARYKMTIKVARTTTQAAGLQLVTFEPGNDVIDIPMFEGDTYELTFIAQSQQRVSLRRNTTNNKYEGLTDIRLERI